MLMMFLDAKDGTKTVSGYPKWMITLVMSIELLNPNTILNSDQSSNSGNGGSTLGISFLLVSMILSRKDRK